MDQVLPDVQGRKHRRFLLDVKLNILVEEADCRATALYWWRSHTAACLVTDECPEVVRMAMKWTSEGSRLLAGWLACWLDDQLCVVRRSNLHSSAPQARWLFLHSQHFLHFHERRHGDCQQQNRRRAWSSPVTCNLHAVWLAASLVAPRLYS